MPKTLPMKETRVYEVTYRDLDTFLNDVFEIPGRIFNVVAVEELMNQVCKDFEVGRWQVDEDEVEEIEETVEQWRNGTFVLASTSQLMEAAHRLGLIPAGKYIVEIGW